MSQWPLQKDLKTFYGNPDRNGDGRADLQWERENLIRVLPPWPMVAAWAPDTPIKSFWCHLKCAPSLQTVLTDIWRNVYSQNLSGIQHDGLHLFGGCYNFRMVRGGTMLSVHAYGAAIDLNPEDNPLGDPWNPAKRGGMPQSVVAAFERQGWEFGGRWKRPDAQHFQAARVA